MSILYILECEGGHYYVGRSKNIQRRLEQHSRGEAGEWTKLYQPLRLITSRESLGEYEKMFTIKHLMTYYGSHNVRGGIYKKIKLTGDEAVFLSVENSLKSSSSYICPRCEEIFFEVVSLYSHRIHCRC